MPISVTCGNCDKKYSVKDELAGKKIRCKACDTVIGIPKKAVDDDDPFGGVEIKSTGRTYEDEDDDEDDRPGRSRGRSASKSKSKPKRKPRPVYNASDGIPAGVGFAILAIKGLILLNCLGLLLSIIRSFTMPLPPRLERSTLILVDALMFWLPVVIRIYIETRVIWGLEQRQFQTRITATIMALLMSLILLGFCGMIAQVPVPPNTAASGIQQMLVMVSLGQLCCELTVILGLNVGYYSRLYLSE